MSYDEYLTTDEIRLMDKLKGKNRMEQDEILGGYENGNIIRNDSTSKQFI